jgi:hypothetical protein
MAIQNELPYGGTGWHGDNAVSLRSTIGDAETLAIDIQTQYDALIAALDANEGTAVAGLATTAPALNGTNFRLQTLAHIAQGGSYVHGDNAVMLREYIAGAIALANEIQTNIGSANLLNALDTASTLTDGDYVAVIGALLTAPAVRAMHPRFANGREASHGDQGVQVRLALEELVAAYNELKAVLNALLTKIENDGGRAAPATTYDPGLLVTAANIT